MVEAPAGRVVKLQVLQHSAAIECSEVGPGAGRARERREIPAIGADGHLDRGRGPGSQRGLVNDQSHVAGRKRLPQRHLRPSSGMTIGSEPLATAMTGTLPRSRRITVAGGSGAARTALTWIASPSYLA